MKLCPICKSEYGGGEVFCPVDGARLVTPSQMELPGGPDAVDHLVGETLGDRYKIIGQIGEGGMGIVYEAMHVVIEKKVALKVLRDDFSKRPEVVERFRQEAKSASRIGHENIVDISDFGETPTRQSYFVMEFLEGEDLANVLAREGTVTADRAVHLVLQCCKALGAAHAKGIVHRDMKPENIFLVKRDVQDDFVKIVDFGIAKMSDIETEGAPGRKLTKTGMIFGTPEYMSPEQAAGKPLDHRVDVYALAVILFEVLTGRVPFVGDTFMGILTQHMFEEVPALRAINPNVKCPEDLELVIFKGLAKDPDERYQTMEEFARAINAAMDLSGAFGDATIQGYGEPVKALSRGPRILDVRPSTAPELGAPRKRASPHTNMYLAIAAVVLLGLGAGAYFALSNTSQAASGGGTGIEVEPLPEIALAPDAAVDATAEEEGQEAEVIAAGPTEVRIQVTTSPAGAQIVVDERGTVCESTPCSFETEVGRPIRIRARRGQLFATRDLEPDQAMAIEINLARRIRPTDRNPNPMMQGGRPMTSDLKTPDIFRDMGD
ncbi:MAG: serine/threonine-protein kinase [Myxococcota bacterium]